MVGRHLPFGAPIVTVAQMQAAEQAVIDRGVSVGELMERAGLAVAREVRRFAAGRPILVAAGPGNNGGDAYVAARHLADWGLDVAVGALGPPREGAAARMAARWTGPVTAIGEAEARPVFVDGLFGTGIGRPLPRDLALHVEALCRGAEVSIAIDLPSGVDPDGIRPASFLGCQITVALGAVKVGHVVGDRAERSGHVLLADIGVPVSSAVSTIKPARLDRPHGSANKFSRGMVAVVGGAMPGASLLASTAAMRAGAGYVLLAEQREGGCLVHALVRRHAPDAATLARLLDDGRIGAVVVGPGLGRDERARALLDRVLESERDLVIDADALTMLGRDVTQRIGADRRQVFLTPHSGEFDRLFGTASGSKLDRTLAAAQASGAIVIHKGSDTVIAAPDGQAIVSAGASPWLSSAGTGDVLAGIVGSCHACDPRFPLRAAADAVWLHAAAAERTPAPFIADDMVERLPAAVAAATGA